jgi:putative transcriptional regulator
MRDWLKKIRTQQGLTQEQVSLQSGIERSYYTMIEQGKRNPSVHVAKSIASTMNFDWTLFFEVKGNETKQIKVQEVS